MLIKPAGGNVICGISHLKTVAEETAADGKCVRNAHAEGTMKSTLSAFQSSFKRILESWGVVETQF